MSSHGVLNRDITAGVSPAAQRKLAGWFFIALSLVGLALSWQWLSSVLRAPFPVTLDQLRQISDPSKLPSQWVSISFGTAQETGMELARADVPKSKFIVIQAQDKWLLAEVPLDFSDREVVGYLDGSPSKLTSRILDGVQAQLPQQQLFRFYLDAEYPYPRNGWLAVCGIGFFFLLGVIGLLGGRAKP